MAATPTDRCGRCMHLLRRCFVSVRQSSAILSCHKDRNSPRYQVWRHPSCVTSYGIGVQLILQTYALHVLTTMRYINVFWHWQWHLTIVLSTHLHSLRERIRNSVINLNCNVGITELRNREDGKSKPKKTATATRTEGVRYAARQTLYVVTHTHTRHTARHGTFTASWHATPPLTRTHARTHTRKQIYTDLHVGTTPSTFNLQRALNRLATTDNDRVVNIDRRAACHRARPAPPSRPAMTQQPPARTLRRHYDVIGRRCDVTSSSWRQTDIQRIRQHAKTHATTRANTGAPACPATVHVTVSVCLSVCVSACMCLYLCQVSRCHSRAGCWQ